MGNEWYLFQNQQRLGPFTWEELLEKKQSGDLESDDKIWSDETSGWIPASEVAGLFDSSKPQPPAPPPPPTPYDSSFFVSLGSFFKILILCTIPVLNIVLLLLWAFGSKADPVRKNLSRAIITWILLIAVICLSLYMIRDHFESVVWHDVQLANPGAENGDLTGWISNGMTAKMSVPQATGTVLPFAGFWFFSSDQGTLSTLTQFVDISLYASEIDEEKAQWNAGFWYQTELCDSIFDTAEGSIIFRDAGYSEIGSVSTGELTSTTWAEESNSGVIPVGTRSVDIVLTGRLYMGSYINAFFDEAYLRIGVP